jgi:iron-sulfur cluster assembly protein
MLTLTENASAVVKEIVSRNGAPEGSGLRINAQDPAATEFAVAVVPTPDPTDSVVEQDGARVYLGETAATALTDKTLDATVADDGRVSFEIGLQG